MIFIKFGKFSAIVQIFPSFFPLLFFWHSSYIYVDAVNDVTHSSEVLYIFLYFFSLSLFFGSHNLNHPTSSVVLSSDISNLLFSPSSELLFFVSLFICLVIDWTILVQFISPTTWSLWGHPSKGTVLGMHMTNLVVLYFKILPSKLIPSKTKLQRKKKREREWRNL